MAYKIEYTPDYVKKDLTAERLRIFSRMLMLLGAVLFAALLWHNQSYMLHALEEMAAQVHNGEGTFNAIAAFYETLQGGMGG